MNFHEGTACPGNIGVRQFDSFIYFSHKADKTWLARIVKQSKTLVNFHHTRGNYARPNTHETKLLATYMEATCQDALQ